jgi:glycogen synthase
LVAPTRAYLGEVFRHHGPHPNARVIANGRAMARFTARKEPMVLAAGRVWDKAKNIAMLAEAVAGSDIALMVAGDDTSPDGSRAGFSGVTMLGRLDEGELAPWMASAAIFAAPARYEPFGLSILEAALQGCALVLADIPSLREVWTGAALFVTPDDARGWRDALARLLAEPARRMDLARRARVHAARYTAARMADEYLAAYATLGERKQAAA